MPTHARYKHIIWDWNGTLLNDTWLCVDVLNALLARRGRGAISNEEYRQNFGFPVIHFYNYLGFDTDTDSFEKISREFIDDYEARWFNECTLHSEASEILHELSHQLGLSNSVLSAAKQEALELGIEYYGLAKHFTQLVGADNIYAKGKVEQGRQRMEQLHWSPDEVVLVGDTLHDHEVAQAMGVDCILMAHGHHTPTRLAETGVPLAHSLRELIELLSK